MNSFTGEGPDGAYPEETGVAAPAAEPQSPAGAAPDSDVADAVPREQAARQRAP